MLVMTKLFCGNENEFLILPFSSTPKTDRLIIVAEFLWKSSKLTAATAPLTLEATALHASPTKSGTLNNLAASFSSFLLTSKCQLYESLRERRAWSAVSIWMTSVKKSGPKRRLPQTHKKQLLSMRQKDLNKKPKVNLRDKRFWMRLKLKRQEEIYWSYKH